MNKHVENGKNIRTRIAWLAVVLGLLLSSSSLGTIPAAGSPGLAANPGERSVLAGKESVPGQLIVKFKPGERPAAGGILEEAGLDGIKTIAVAKVFPEALPPDESREMVRKKHPALVARAPKMERTPDLSEIYLLEFSAEEDVGTVCSMVASLPGVEYAEPNRLVLTEEQQTINIARDDVDPFEVHYKWPTNDPLLPEQWSLINHGQSGGTLDADIDAEKGWRVTTGNPNVVIAMVDGGVDCDHEDLASKIWTNAGEVPSNGLDDDQNGFVDDVRGWDFCSGDNDPDDEGYMATHLAGVAAAATDNGVGIAGVAPLCLVMPVRSIRTSGSPDGPVSGEAWSMSSTVNLARGFKYAADNGADVVFSRYSDENSTPRLMLDALGYSHSFGCIIVSPAGDFSANNTANSFPGNARETIAVGPTDHDDNRLPAAAFGPLEDLCAPGVGITSTIPGNSYLNLGQRHSSIKSALAAAHVAGAAALVASRHYGEFDFTNEDVRQILRSSTDDIGEPGWDPSTSNGRLNLAKALTAGKPARCDITDPVNNFSYFPGDIEVRGTASGPGFKDYRLEYAEGLNPDPGDWQVISNSTAPVEDGILGTWCTAGVPEGEYLVRLTVNAWRGSLAKTYTCYSRLFISRDTLPGWPQPTEGTPSSTVIADLDADGTPEVLASSCSGFIYAWEPDGSEYLDGDSNPATTGVFVDQGICSYVPIKVGDIDGDGDPEVVTGTGNPLAWWSGGEIHAYHHDGTLVDGWPPEHSGQSWLTFSSAMGEMDGDAGMEVAGLIWVRDGQAQYESKVFLFDDHGQPLPGWPKPLELSQVESTGLAMGDLDGDGRHELVAVGNGIVHAWNSDGSDAAGWPRIVPGLYPDSSPAIGDIDSNGSDDVVLVSKGTVYSWYGNGGVVPNWPREISGYGGDDVAASSAILADIDPYPGIETVLSWGNPFGGAGKVCAWHWDGTEVVDGDQDPWTQGVFAVTGDWPSSPIAGDFDNDSSPEIVVSDKGVLNPATVYCWRRDGNLLPGWPKQLRAEGSDCASIGDLDGDGSWELIEGARNFSIWIFPDCGQGNAFGVEWEQSRYDCKNSGFYR